MLVRWHSTVRHSEVRIYLPGLRSIKETSEARKNDQQGEMKEVRWVRLQVSQFPWAATAMVKFNFYAEWDVGESQGLE